MEIKRNDLPDKQTIAIYLQHYLSLSMTFIYRLFGDIKKKYNLILFCSRIYENQKLFPYNPIFFKKKSFLYSNYLKIKERFFGLEPFTFVSIDPILSLLQKRYFKKKILKNKVSLVHAHFGPSGLEIHSVLYKLKIPLIVTFHGYDASSLLKNPKYIENIKILFNYAYIITVSNYMKDVLCNYGLNASRCEVIYCGIPVDKFPFVSRRSLFSKSDNNAEIKFLQVSNFVEKKGHEYTVKAFSLFLKDYPNAKLILAGDGELLSQIKSLTKELKIENKVFFTGKVQENSVFRLMEESDIFLHHSITSKNGDMEGIPTVIMEALSTGLPVISTRHSGIPELIEDGKNGFLVEEKDIMNYYKKMIHILKDDGQLGKNARKTIELKFNLDLQNKKLLEVYSKLLNEK